MLYVEKTLSAGEEIKEIVKLHRIKYMRLFLVSSLNVILIIGYLISLFGGGKVSDFVAIIPFALWGVYEFLRINSIEMVATNKRIVYKNGILSVNTEEIKNTKVESIEIRQDVLGKCFDYATICFSGTGNSKIEFKYCADAFHVKGRIESIVEASQNPIPPGADSAQTTSPQTTNDVNIQD